jgi:prefoldin subunit 5
MSDQELEDKIQELKREIDILNARIASLVDDPMWRTLEEFERRRKKDLEYWRARR